MPNHFLSPLKPSCALAFIGLHWSDLALPLKKIHAQTEKRLFRHALQPEIFGAAHPLNAWSIERTMVEYEEVVRGAIERQHKAEMLRRVAPLLSPFLRRRDAMRMLAMDFNGEPPQVGAGYESAPKCPPKAPT